MSAIIERVRRNKERLAPKLRSELENKPLSRLLRRESWPDHERAQYSPFELALAGGTISRIGYADLLVQVLPVYKALEERGEALRTDPLAGRVHFPQLARSANIEQDIVFYAGESWATSATLLPVTEEYVARVRGATPLQFVAHHYNRYLADLSGGLIIARALRRSWQLDGEGLRYYDFPEILDAVAFKDDYRAILDGLPLDIGGKLELIEEVMLAYEYNIEMADELARRHLEPAGA